MKTRKIFIFDFQFPESIRSFYKFEDRQIELFDFIERSEHLLNDVELTNEESIDLKLDVLSVINSVVNPTYFVIHHGFVNLILHERSYRKIIQFVIGTVGSLFTTSTYIREGEIRYVLINTLSSLLTEDLIKKAYSSLEIGGYELYQAVEEYIKLSPVELTEESLSNCIESNIIDMSISNLIHNLVNNIYTISDVYLYDSDISDKEYVPLTFMDQFKSPLFIKGDYEYYTYPFRSLMLSYLRFLETREDLRTDYNLQLLLDGLKIIIKTEFKDLSIKESYVRDLLSTLCRVYKGRVPLEVIFSSAKNLGLSTLDIDTRASNSNYVIKYGDYESSDILRFFSEEFIGGPEKSLPFYFPILDPKIVEELFPLRVDGVDKLVTFFGTSHNLDISFDLYTSRDKKISEIRGNTFKEVFKLVSSLPEAEIGVSEFDMSSNVDYRNPSYSEVKLSMYLSELDERDDMTSFKFLVSILRAVVYYGRDYDCFIPKILDKVKVGPNREGLFDYFINTMSTSRLVISLSGWS